MRAVAVVWAGGLRASSGQRRYSPAFRVTHLDEPCYAFDAPTMLGCWLPASGHGTLAPRTHHTQIRLLTMAPAPVVRPTADNLAQLGICSHRAWETTKTGRCGCFGDVTLQPSRVRRECSGRGGGRGIDGNRHLGPLAPAQHRGRQKARDDFFFPRHGSVQQPTLRVLQPLVPSRSFGTSMTEPRWQVLLSATAIQLEPRFIDRGGLQLCTRKPLAGNVAIAWPSAIALLLHHPMSHCVRLEGCDNFIPHAHLAPAASHAQQSCQQIPRLFLK